MKRFLVLLLVFGASAAYGEVYTWKDARGTVFYTNSLHEIPARYLKKARVLDVATGKKAGLATAQPGVQSAPAAFPGQTPVQQAPNPAASPPPAIPSDATPAAANSAPSVPPAADITQPRLQPTERQRRSQRRRYRSEVEEE